MSKVCSDQKIGPGEMLEVEVEEHRILVLRLSEGEIRAYSGLCPHENLPLVYGEFDGEELICSAHFWTFDGKSGECTDPGGCRLARYPIQIKDGEIFVDVE